MSTKTSLLGKTFHAFVSSPLFFLLVQIPEASAEVVYELLTPYSQNNLILTFALFFPYLCVVSFLSSAAVFLGVDALSRGRKPSFSEIFHKIWKKIGVLIPVSLLTGFIALLGLVALILPFLYFLAIYLFVPMLVVTESKQPWSVYLHQSKIQSKLTFKWSLAAVLVMLGVQVGQEILFRELARFGGGGENATFALFGLKLLTQLVSSSMIGIWISYYFLHQGVINKR